jgi:hypothetical protein
MSKEYIDREEVTKILEHYDLSSGSTLGCHSGAIECAISAIEMLPAADVAPAVELEDLRAKYQALVAEKTKNSGDTAETYTTGYRYGHRNGQIELLQQILNICDSTSEPEE